MAGRNEKPKLATPAEIRKMFNSIAWYYPYTNVLEMPEDLVQKLPKSPADMCRTYSG